MPNYLRNSTTVKTEKIKFVLDKFLELITDDPKLPNYVTTARASLTIYIIVGIKKFTKVVESVTWVWSVGLIAPKPFQV